MKKIKLLYVILLLAFTQVSGQSVTFNEAGGWLETAFVKWQPVQNAGKYNVYYSGEGVVDKKIDDYLIRSYGSYFRADVLGLKAGTYTITVKPVILGVEGAGSTTANLTVLPHDRNGFAFHGGRVPGGYKADGTPKDNAIILYITQNSKNTISYDVVTKANGGTTNYVGFQSIFSGLKKGYDNRPYIFRLVGNITDFAVMEGGDLVIENDNNANSYVTVEGVGDDATANGWGIRVKNATNIQINNIGFLNCESGEGDNIGMQQNNSYIWAHNNDLFYGNAGSDADQIKGDGALDNKGTSYATYAYNHFWDSGKGSLLGLSEGSTAGLYVTYHHNWFDHSDSRHPRVRYYSTHIYNNYFDGISKYGSGSTEGSSLFLEGNYFRNAKNPMMISLQGTDVWNNTTQQNDPNNMGTFSGEDGGMIKAFNNFMDADIATNSMRFVAYGDTNPLYNIAGKISSLTDFDAFVPATRGEIVPATVKSKVGAKTYNNFDTDAALYVKNLVIEEPVAARDRVKMYAGRVQGGDIKWTFNNAVDDISYAVIPALKALLTGYGTNLVYIQAEMVSGQTLVNTSANKDQSVTPGTAIAPIIFTYGGDATDVVITGLPANGLTVAKNATAKTATITGTPTATTAYTVTTTGTTGTAVSISGTVTVGNTPPPTTGGEIHNFTTSEKVSTFYTITGNMNSTNGTQSYDGNTLTRRLKIESSTSINYTTTQTSNLTLVFDADFNKVMKFDGANYTATAGIVTINNIAAGTHSITKGDTTNLFYIKTVYPTMATNDSDKAQISVYPNPVSDYLKINTAGQKILSVKVYSFAGNVVKNIADVKGDSVDLRNLNTGSYIVTITTDKGTVTKKIIKK